ncbi:hypothetical protein EG329_004124 [Mollisiaceae sp. DMI_Dod_QoI]|nr:hypothetical protein EG329_004124 [Helotiales sp. DMI_Dod_QoI]
MFSFKHLNKRLPEMGNLNAEMDIAAEPQLHSEVGDDAMAQASQHSSSHEDLPQIPSKLLLIKGLDEWVTLDQVSGKFSAYDGFVRAGVSSQENRRWLNYGSGFVEYDTEQNAMLAMLARLPVSNANKIARPFLRMWDHIFKREGPNSEHRLPGEILTKIFHEIDLNMFDIESLGPQFIKARDLYPIYKRKHKQRRDRRLYLAAICDLSENLMHLTTLKGSSANYSGIVKYMKEDFGKLKEAYKALKCRVIEDIRISKEGDNGEAGAQMDDPGLDSQQKKDREDTESSDDEEDAHMEDAYMEDAYEDPDDELEEGEILE